MVTGRVEVREEVLRTGCSESVREEVVGDAYRHSSLPVLYTQREQSLVYSVKPLSVVCRRLISLLFSRRLSSQVAEDTEALGHYTQYISLSISSLSHARIYTYTHAQTDYSWQTHHRLADSPVTMETQHQVRNSCTSIVVECTLSRVAARGSASFPRFSQ